MTANIETHRFYADDDGAEYCECGYERRLYGDAWGYRIEDSDWLATYLEGLGLPANTRDSHGHWPHPCPVYA